jgi:hypothetical protein
MEKLNRKALISPDGLSALVHYKGELLTIPLRFNFWQWCECELAELQRSRTVLAAMPEGMEAKLEKLVTAEVEKLMKLQPCGLASRAALTATERS